MRGRLSTAGDSAVKRSRRPLKTRGARAITEAMQPMAAATARPRRRPRQPRGRDFTVVARAERGGRILCSAALVLVKSSPGLLGIEPTDAITAWFYGDVRPAFELELAEMAHAARNNEVMPEGEPI